jgi:2-polyprenyl-6-methoxyphenol hydroxylase-like FAD-dependent oxidoreductase
MAETLDTPVLVVGGGPTGLVLASALSRFGIDCVLAERNMHTTRFPKMDVTNGPSIELLRRLDADEELRRVGVAPQHSFDVIFAPSLDGPEIARWVLPSVDQQHANSPRNARSLSVPSTGPTPVRSSTTSSVHNRMIASTS